MNKELFEFIKNHYIIQVLIAGIPIIIFFLLPSFDLKSSVLFFSKNIQGEEVDLFKVLMLTILENIDNYELVAVFIKIVLCLLLFIILFSITFFIFTINTNSKNIQKIEENLSNYNNKYKNIYSTEFFKQLNHDSRLNIATNLSMVDELIEFNSSSQEKEAEEKLQSYHLEKKMTLNNKLEAGVELTSNEELFMERNYMVLKRDYCKTYLNNDYFILDITQKVKILENKNTIYRFYYGFHAEEYASEEFRDELITTLISNYNILSGENRGKDIDCEKLNRFKYSNFHVKKRNNINDIKLTNISKVDIEKAEKFKSKGFEIICNLGKYEIGRIIEVKLSLTLPSSLNYSSEPDTIVFNHSSVFTHITIQEEIYGNSHFSKAVTFEKNDIPLDDDQINRNTSLYYHSNNITMFYNDNQKETFKVIIEQN